MNTVVKMETPTLSSTIGEAAGAICSDGFPTGDRAKLRRMSPGETPPAAFYRFAFRHLPDGWEQSQRQWMVVTAGIAIMAPSAHNRVVPAGTAMAESRYSEKRVEMLLAATGEVQETLVLRLARFLSAKGQPVDWTQLAQLLFSKEPEKADAIRMRIARDYYRVAREEKRGQ